MTLPRPPSPCFSEPIDIDTEALCRLDELDGGGDSGDVGGEGGLDKMMQRW